MSEPLLPRIDETLARASASGALQSIHTERAVLEEDGIAFGVRWVSSLARKDAARVEAAGRRDPDFDPFLPPDPALTVASLGPDHLAVLNKYPVIARHLLIVTRAFEAQTVPLGRADFGALAAVMAELGGLGFYNGGTKAGASQAHKHLQWIPSTAEGASLDPFVRRLPPTTAPGSVTTDPALPWHHSFVRLPDFAGTAPSTVGAQLHEAFQHGCEAAGIAPDRDPMPPYNLLVGSGWLAVVPRRQEHSDGISVNALGFAGSLFVRRPEQIDVVRSRGPLRLLADVACER